MARAVSHLAIISAELTTVAFVVPTLATQYFWLRKPSEIETGIPLVVDATIEEILEHAGGRARHAYSLTPLDFVARKDWMWNYIWAYWIYLLKQLRLISSPTPRPIQRIPNDNFPPITGSMNNTILVIFQGFYSGILVAGWSLHYPTFAECILWRASTVYILACIVIYWALDRYAAYHYPPSRTKDPLYHNASSKFVGEGNGRTEYCRVEEFRQPGDRFRHFGNPHDLYSYLPIRTILSLSLFPAIYCFARVAIILEDVISLRELPTTTFQTVQWTSFLSYL